MFLESFQWLSLGSRRVHFSKVQVGPFLIGVFSGTSVMGMLEAFNYNALGLVSQFSELSQISCAVMKLNLKLKHFVQPIS